MSMEFEFKRSWFPTSDKERKFKCPWCNAGKSEPCWTPRLISMGRRYHKARRVLAVGV